ncbi:aldo/keto reductase [Thermosynechococcaceae cyanobacterium BACA0444]|uniref:Aldo/keto reductase n=1 Tax=Pseudocalidococcus azoricus BACA0444 TaxID=2918990 RepID=A0AAE4JX45_9CYAN|nr:aldo/keto reductase [Pseudocalidococcus azoricus]MDS3862125.1 aldo/keto reductase [Pseudocalidococcus azoricus BACA0444]
MLYRRFGRTNLAMPVFSCGGMRYQYKWQDTPWAEIPADNQHNLEATIHQALALGINHIETARGYGTSELQLGQILPKIRREKLIVQTKVSPTANSVEFSKTLEQSLNNLNLDYVDLLGIHGINNAELLDQTLRPGGCLEVAQQFQAQGRVRFIGFSTHGPLEIILPAIESGQFDYLNLHWYYINQTNWPAILAAQKQDLGVFIISPTNKGGMLNQPPARLMELCQPLSPMVFNDLFCLSHPQVHTLSIGAAHPEDFPEHLKTLELLSQADTILPPILHRLNQALIETLGQDWCETWTQGLPDYTEVPGQINIRTILWLRNLALAWGLVDYGRMRYNLLGNGSHWFPGEQAKDLECISHQQLQQCLQNSPQREMIPQLLVETHQLLGGAAQKRLSQS